MCQMVVPLNVIWPIGEIAKYGNQDRHGVQKYIGAGNAEMQEI
jgi:hypothetical protein